MSELSERLRLMCIDWDGTDIADEAETISTVDCGTMREAANELERLYTLAKANNDLARRHADELTALRAQVSRLTADLEVAVGALEDGLGQLHWINAQAVSIMESTNHVRVANEDSAVARMMIDSMASDIGVNAMMLHDKLSATLNTIRKDG